MTRTWRRTLQGLLERSGAICKAFTGRGRVVGQGAGERGVMMAGDGELIAGRYYISPEQRAKLTPEQYAKFKRSLEEDAPVDDFLEELQQRVEDGSMSTDELRRRVTELDRLRAASARGSDA